MLEEAYYGLLEDSMFKSIGFELPEKPFILDIDLDYFMRLSDFEIEADTIFKALVQGADLITVARSVKYFEYLKKEEFSIEECEARLIDLLKYY